MAGCFYVCLSIVSTGIVGPFILSCLYCYDQRRDKKLKTAESKKVVDDEESKVAPEVTSAEVTVTHVEVRDSSDLSNLESSKEPPENNLSDSAAQTHQSAAKTSNSNDLLKLANPLIGSLSSSDPGIEIDFSRSKFKNKWSSRRDNTKNHVSKCSQDLLDCLQDEPDLLAPVSNGGLNTADQPPTVTSFTLKSLSKVRRNSMVGASSPTGETEYHAQFKKSESTSKTSLTKPVDQLGAHSMKIPSESSPDTSVGN